VNFWIVSAIPTFIRVKSLTEEYRALCGVLTVPLFDLFYLILMFVIPFQIMLFSLSLILLLRGFTTVRFYYCKDLLLRGFTTARIYYCKDLLLRGFATARI
jgi:hypothetical protein